MGIIKIYLNKTYPKYIAYMVTLSFLIEITSNNQGGPVPTPPQHFGLLLIAKLQQPFLASNVRVRAVWRKWNTGRPAARFFFV